jgi:hypothetical protein
VKRHGNGLSKFDKQDLLGFTKKPRSRSFYALPKSHKPIQKWTNGVPPMRPICPDVMTETSMSAKFIAAFLVPFVERIPTYVANSYIVLQNLAALRNIPDTAVWLVADTDSLYPNIPVQDAYDTIRALFGHDSVCDESQIRALVLELLRIHLYNNYFDFEGEHFLQIRGIPMGKA